MLLGDRSLKDIHSKLLSISGDVYWTSGTNGAGGASGRTFSTDNFWRGEIAEIILINNISVDLDAYYASAKEAFGLT